MGFIELGGFAGKQTCSTCRTRQQAASEVTALSTNIMCILVVVGVITARFDIIILQFSLFSQVLMNFKSMQISKSKVHEFQNPKPHRRRFGRYAAASFRLL